MEIVRNPQKYGEEAELGIFISVDELSRMGGTKILDRLEKMTMNQLKNAEKRLEFYQDLLDSGEASSRQQTSLDKWESLVCNLKQSLSSIIEAKKQLNL